MKHYFCTIYINSKLQFAFQVLGKNKGRAQMEVVHYMSDTLKHVDICNIQFIVTEIPEFVKDTDNLEDAIKFLKSEVK